MDFAKFNNFVPITRKSFEILLLPILYIFKNKSVRHQNWVFKNFFMVRATANSQAHDYYT